MNELVGLAKTLLGPLLNRHLQRKQDQEKHTLELIEEFRKTKPIRDEVYEQIGNNVWSRPMKEYERRRPLYDCLELIARETASDLADKNLLFQQIGQDYVEIRQAVEQRIHKIAGSAINLGKFKKAVKSQPQEKSWREIFLTLKKKEYDHLGYCSKLLKDEWSKKLKAANC